MMISGPTIPPRCETVSGVTVEPTRLPASTCAMRLTVIGMRHASVKMLSAPMTTRENSSAPAGTPER